MGLCFAPLIGANRRPSASPSGLRPMSVPSKLDSALGHRAPRSAKVFCRTIPLWLRAQFVIAFGLGPMARSGRPFIPHAGGVDEAGSPEGRLVFFFFQREASHMKAVRGGRVVDRLRPWHVALRYGRPAAGVTSNS